jgi:peptide/nickel transport system substrate-binding protein/oligopeptide transport system substrate-binding protein
MLTLMGATGATAALVACGAATPTAAPTAVPATKAPEPTAAPATKAPEATAVPATKAPAPTVKPTDAPKMVTSGGKQLPADAAPADQQIILGAAAVPGPGQGVDAQITASVYARGGLADIWALPLTRLNHDFEMIPGAATEWKVSDDGLKWTFTLRKDMPWSDGSGMVNADDFIATFQHLADPKVAYDFTWYWDAGNGNLKGLGDALKGTITPDKIGVSKTDDYTLVVETSVPTPYLPRLCVYMPPFNAKALKAMGTKYMIDPKTAISAGPFVVTSYEATRWEAVANKNVPDDIKPYLERIINVPYPNGFQAYQAGQIDQSSIGNAADLQTASNDPTLAADIRPDVGDFRTDYFFFNVNKAPYDNPKFREALGHLLDREAIGKNISKLLARPAYSFLAAGFPAANPEGLRDIQSFDVDKAKKAYADSGVKVDKLTLTYRDDFALYEAISAFYADSIKTNLGITVEIKKLPVKDFSAALLAKPDSQIDFGAISYGMDYLDPSNMLGVFIGNKKGGRHTWNDPAYQDLLAKAGPMTDIAARTKLYQDAEKLMTQSFAFIWMVTRTPLNLLKPYVKGEGSLPGKVNKNPGFAWPGMMATFTPYISSTYIGNNVPKRAIP